MTMHCPTLTSALLAIAGIFSAPGFAPAQHVATDIVEAEAVVVGRAVGTQAMGSEFQTYRIEVLVGLGGNLDAGASFSIATRRRVSDQTVPPIGETRLYCLRKDPLATELPANRGPWMQVVGTQLAEVSQPNDKDPVVRLAQTLLESETGLAPRDVADRLMTLAFVANKTVRSESVRILTLRNIVRDHLTEVQRNQIATRAIGETEDVRYKIRLASLAATFRLDGFLIDLCHSIDRVEDLRFARALGRIARYMHGERSGEMLLQERLRNRDEDVQRRVLVAAGATRSTAALEALAEMHEHNPNDKWVRTALAAHASPQARKLLREASARQKAEKSAKNTGR